MRLRRAATFVAPLLGLAFGPGHPAHAQSSYTFTDLGAPTAQGYLNSNGFSVNDLGHVAGLVQTGSQPYQAFYWDSAGGFRLLGTFGGARSVANCINRNDEVVGNAD